MRGTGINNDRGGSCPLCTYSTVGSGWKGKEGKENGRKNSTGIPKQLKTSFCAVEWGMERFIFKWEEGGRANIFMGRGWGKK